MILSEEKEVPRRALIQRGDDGEGPPRNGRVDALAEAEGGLACEAEAEGGPPDINAREGGSLDGHPGRLRPDRGLEGGHDPGKAGRDAARGDDDVASHELALFPVHRDEFALVVVDGREVISLEGVEVVHVEGLPGEEHRVVADVDDGVDRADARGDEPAPQPGGRFLVLQPFGRDEEEGTALFGRARG